MQQFVDYYPYLTEKEQEVLSAISTIKTFRKKESLFDTSGTVCKVAFILHGMVKGYFVNDQGGERTVFLSEEGLFTGAPESVFRSGTTKYKFEAVIDSEIMLFNCAELYDLSNLHLGIARMMIESYMHITQVLISRLESHIDKLPEGRYDELIEKRPHFFQKAYHKDVANYLGISPVSLSRIIRRKLHAET